MTEVKENVIQDSEVTELKEEKVSWGQQSDTVLINELMDRDMQVPLDDGKLVRLAAIRMLKAADEAARPLSSYSKMRVIFHRSGRDGEAPYVFVGLNGRSTQIPYDKEVVVPEPVIRTCIDNAVITEYALDSFDMKTGTVTATEKAIRAVPYTFLGFED